MDYSKVCEEVLDENPKYEQMYLSGKTVIGVLIGLTLRRLEAHGLKEEPRVLAQSIRETIKVRNNRG